MEWKTPPPVRIGSAVAFVAPVMGIAMRGATSKDLKALKQVLERG